MTRGSLTPAPTLTLTLTLTSAVETSYKLWVVDVVLSLLIIPVTFIGGEKFTGIGFPEVEQTFPPDLDAQLSAELLMMFLAGFMVIVVVFEYFLATKMRACICLPSDPTSACPPHPSRRK